MAKTGRRRGFKSILVEPYLQVKLGLMFIVVNTVFAVLMLAAFSYYVYDMFNTLSVYFKLSEQENLITASKLTVPLIVIGGMMLAFFATTIYVSVRYTHHIYGPLVSIHRFLDEMLAGQKPRAINLRESDQLQDLAAKLNTMADKFFEGRK